MKTFDILDKLNFFDKLFEEKVKIGLDIGADSVKFVQLKEGPKVINHGYKQFPNDHTSGRSEEIIASALRALWKEKRIKGKEVRVAVSDPEIYLRHISVPKVAKEELIKAVKWQAEKYISFPIDDAIVEFQTLGSSLKEGLDQMDIIIVAAKKITVKKYLRVISSAGLVPVILDICPFAAARAYLSNYAPNADAATTIIDVGAKVTSIIVLKGESLEFVRTIELKPPVAPFFMELAKEINRSLAYCEAELFIRKVDRIILCGGGARSDGLEKYLGQETGLPVEIGDPFKRMGLVDPAGHCLMAALGAALS
ncbi:MAG: pilus assembly protein PilM [Candidatus Omnitrophica bacterium]|nr:pilus assembly protein PilM [Candidatus Omnitrophota bacterium]